MYVDIRCLHAKWIKFRRVCGICCPMDTDTTLDPPSALYSNIVQYHTTQHFISSHNMIRLSYMIWYDTTHMSTCVVLWCSDVMYNDTLTTLKNHHNHIFCGFSVIFVAYNLPKWIFLCSAHVSMITCVVYTLYTRSLSPLLHATLACITCTISQTTEHYTYIINIINVYAQPIYIHLPWCILYFTLLYFILF